MYVCVCLIYVIYIYMYIYICITICTFSRETLNRESVNIIICSLPSWWIGSLKRTIYFYFTSICQVLLTSVFLICPIFLILFHNDFVFLLLRRAKCLPVFNLRFICVIKYFAHAQYVDMSNEYPMSEVLSFNQTILHKISLT